MGGTTGTPGAAAGTTGEIWKIVMVIVGDDGYIQKFKNHENVFRST